MFNAFEELFAPGRKHTRDERNRLELTRADVGDGDPGHGPIDLGSGKVVVHLPHPKDGAYSARDDDSTRAEDSARDDDSTRAEDSARAAAEADPDGGPEPDGREPGEPAAAEDRPAAG